MNSLWRLLPALILVGMSTSTKSAVAAERPGQAWLVLTPAPAPGEFDAESYLQDPAGWTAQADSFADGWGVMYRSAEAPPDWPRPFTIRAGGAAAKAGQMHPRYALALAEMLPNPTGAMAAMRAAPNPDACSPGQPNPMPLFRSGWQFLHDGWISVTELNRGLWLLDLDAGWDEFKFDHPRDFNGNSQEDRGNAGEIYFLLLLYELDRAGGDMQVAMTHTLHRLSALPGAEYAQFNAVIQGNDCTWAIRYAPARADEYTIHFSRTITGAYCLTDSIPAGAGGFWQEVPNYQLARFAPDSPVQFYPIEFSAADEPDGIGPAETAMQLVVISSPAVDRIGIRLTLPAATSGWLELLDLEGRRLVSLPISNRDRNVTLVPPASAGSGLYWIRLIQGGRECRRRVVLLR